jgi:hypothetical protein
VLFRSETVKEYDPLAIHRAIVNLLRRRGMTVTPRLWEETNREFYWTDDKGRQDEQISNAKGEKE